MAIKIRAGEDRLDKHFYRTKRIVQANGCWFFLTRESGQEGPFSSANEAQLSLQMFLALTDSSLLASVNRARKGSQPDTERFTLHTASSKNSSSPPRKKNKRIATPNRMEFSPVARGVKAIASKSKQPSANDGFEICFL